MWLLRVSHEQVRELGRHGEIGLERSAWTPCPGPARGAPAAGPSHAWELLEVPACPPDCLIPRPRDGELLMSPNENQKGNQVTVSRSGDIYHTALKIWRVDCLFQLVIPNPEKRQHVEQMCSDWAVPALQSEKRSRGCCKLQQTGCPVDGWERTGNDWTWTAM